MGINPFRFASEIDWHSLDHLLFLLRLVQQGLLTDDLLDLVPDVLIFRTNHCIGLVCRHTRVDADLREPLGRDLDAGNQQSVIDQALSAD